MGFSGFLDSHPGGAHVFLRHKSRDITADYDLIHPPELVHQTLPASASVGNVDPATVSQIKYLDTQAATETEGDPVLLNLKDFELAAERKASAAAWAYFESAADDEISKAHNLRAFRKVTLRPRILRNVENINARTTILGKSSSMPIFVAPCGLNKLAHPQGECGITSAAGKAGLIQVISTGASMSPESIMAARIDKSQPVFFQLYVNKDIEKSKSLIRRVERLGFSSIWLTVDSPVLGKRERDGRIKARDNVSCDWKIEYCADKYSRTMPEVAELRSRQQVIFHLVWIGTISNGFGMRLLFLWSLRGFNQ